MYEIFVLIADLFDTGLQMFIKGRKKSDPVMNTIGLSFGGFIISLLLISFVPIPNMAAAPYLAGIAIINSLYLVWAKALRTGEVSTLHPVYVGCTPIMATFAAILMGKEFFSLLTLISVLIVVFGILLVFFSQRNNAVTTRKAFFLAIFVGSAMGISVPINAYGMAASGTIIGYLVWDFLIATSLLLTIGLITQGKHAVIETIKSDPLKCGLGGICQMSVVGLTSMTIGILSVPSSIAASLRAITIFLVMIGGIVIYKETASRLKILGAIISFIGIVTIYLF